MTAVRQILVTGGAGFIASHLARRLAGEGHHVHLLHRPGTDLRRISDLRASTHFIACDLVDEERLTLALDAVQPEVIYHTAGDTSLRHIDPSLGGVVGSIERNIRPSINLFVAAQATCSRLSLLVRLGGIEEYGLGPVPYSEEQRELPISPYSASQVAVTHYLQMLTPYLKYRTVIVRPALIYGPAQSTQFFIPSLIEHCLKGLDFPMSSGSQGRDFLYVDDLIDALAMLHDCSFPGGDILNIGSGREYVVSDVAAAIVRMTQSPTRLLKGVFSRPTEVTHPHLSTHKVEARTGWRPKVGLEEGLARTIAWYRQASASLGP